MYFWWDIYSVFLTTAQIHTNFLGGVLVSVTVWSQKRSFGHNFLLKYVGETWEIYLAGALSTECVQVNSIDFYLLNHILILNENITTHSKFH